jgi:hypothetical protein
MVETVFVHESGEVMECGLLHVPAGKQDPQGYGSALTAAYKATNGEQAWQTKAIDKKDAKKAQLEATLSKELAK